MTHSHRIILLSLICILSALNISLFITYNWVQLEKAFLPESSIPNIIQAITSLGTLFTVLILFLDYKKNSEAEERRFKFDSEPLLIVKTYSSFLYQNSNYFNDLKDSLHTIVDQKGNKKDVERKHDISRSDVILIIENKGKSHAKDIKIEVSNTIEFPKKSIDRIFGGNVLVGEKIKILNVDKKINTNDIFYIRFSYSSYSTKYIYTSKYKIVVVKGVSIEGEEIYYIQTNTLLSHSSDAARRGSLRKFHI